MAALKCLACMTSLPHSVVYPHQNEVIRSLATGLNDHKRLVRKEAVNARSNWYAESFLLAQLWNKLAYDFSLKTSTHSGRMRTGHLLTVSQHALGGGRGVYPSMHWAGGSAQGGVAYTPPVNRMTD